MTSKLVALLDGNEIGRVNRDARGRIRFVYDDEWRKAADAYPLSLSMPIGAKEHGRAVTEAFLWGLLPDKTEPIPVVPEWPEFIRGCVRYRQSLDIQAPAALRTNKPYEEP